MSTAKLDHHQNTNLTERRKRIQQELKVLFLLVFITILSTGFASTLVAQSTKQVSMNSSISISETGNARVNLDVHMPMKAYSLVKQQFGNAQYMARMMSNSVSWSEIKDLQGKFQDTRNVVNAQLTHIGYAKPYKPGKWVIDLSKEELTFVVMANNVAHFSATLDLPFGATHVLCKIVLPKESKNHRYDRTKKKLYYDFVPKFEEGDNSDISFELETKPKIMSSLAQIYGNEKFDNFWVARSRFENTGNKVIKNLRIRYRVANLSAWSGWKKTQIVYPGQTVVEPFFPVLDVEAIAKFTSTRNAMVEVQYRYDVDGEKEEDTDSGKTQILARNEVEWSSYEITETMNFFENFNNSPSIYGAFCTTNDPVVQQVAGAVARMIGGKSPSTDKDAMLYMKGIWTFLKMNDIAYQLPPGGVVDGKSLQHLKYARDVLRNKAGTCADLAVIWASIARAGGLKPCVVCVPGHAYPAIILPQSGRPVAIESTLISGGTFQSALQKGAENFAKHTQDGRIIIVNINDMHSKGVHCLDLPAVGTDFLKDLGYKMELPAAQPRQNPGQNQTQVNNTPTPNRPKALCGTWKAELVAPGGTGIAVFQLNANGTASSYSKIYDHYGNLINSDTDKGTWSVQGNFIKSYSTIDKETILVPYKLTAGTLYVTIDGVRLACTKVR